MKNLSNIIFTKPKFTGLPSAWLEHVPLAFYLIEILKPSLFVELGTFTGASYFSFCQAVKQLGVSTQSFAIDHWKGDFQSGFINDRVFQLVDNINRNHFHEFSKLLRMSFDEALPNFENNTIDLLHIDGCHTYEAAKHDFETWLPKMSDRGVVLFHDTQERVGDFGVWKLFQELKLTYTTCEFLHGHGLGIVCTGKHVSQDFIEFVHNCDENSFSQKLFAALGKLAASEKYTSSHKAEAGKQPVLIAKLYFSQADQNFSEINSVYSFCAKNESELMFQITSNEKISQFRFDPLENYLLIKLNDIRFYHGVKPVFASYQLSSNAVYVVKDVFLFSTQDPSFTISFREPLLIDNVIFNVEYLETGIKTLESMAEVINKLKTENELLQQKQRSYYQMFLSKDTRSDDLDGELQKTISRLLILHHSRFNQLLLWIEKSIKFVMFKMIGRKK